jgi:hypothetical protein
VDVNVHPAKSAVGLRGGRSAYPLVVGTIRAALAVALVFGGEPLALVCVGVDRPRCITRRFEACSRRPAILPWR